MPTSHAVDRGRRRARLLDHRNPPIIAWSEQRHAIASLKAHRDRSTRKSDDLVFPNKSGEPLRESKLLERMLQPAAERAGLGRVTWHQFRHIHSFAPREFAALTTVEAAS